MSTTLSFNDLTRLSDQDVQVLLRQVDQKDLVVTLVGAAKAISEKFLGNMSERVRGFIKEEIAALGEVPKAQIEETRQRLISQVVQLAEQGLITHEKVEKKAPKRKARFSKEYLAMKREVRKIAKRPLQQLNFDEINQMFTNLAEIARREGVLELENIVQGNDEDFLTYAMRLIVDGTEPALIMDILESWKESLMREHERKYIKAIEAAMAIQAGDNPRLIESKLQRIY